VGNIFFPEMSRICSNNCSPATGGQIIKSLFHESQYKFLDEAFVTLDKGTSEHPSFPES